MSSLHWLVLSTLVVGMLTGCANERIPDDPAAGSQEMAEEHQTSTTAADAFTHVVTSETPYYLDGPQQGRPPDGTLATGTKVKLLEEAGSYVRVETETGVTAFVAADAIQSIARGKDDR